MSEIYGTTLAWLILTLILTALASLFWSMTKRSYAHRLHNARVTDSFEYGPGSAACPGMVRMTMSANAITVYDFEMDVDAFLAFAEHVERWADQLQEITV